MKGSTETVICIRCPNSCEIEVETSDGDIVSIEGQECWEGKEHAQKEISNPERTLTTTVKLKNGVFPLVSVRTSEPVAKSELIQLMDKIASIQVTAPIERGEILYEDIDGEGSDLVATKTVKEKNSDP